MEDPYLEYDAALSGGSSDPWWTWAPLAGAAVIVGLLASLAVWLLSAPTVRGALLAPAAAPAAFGVGALSAVCGLGFLATGVAATFFLRDRHRAHLDQEGLIEEISQEFEKVRDEIGEERRRASLTEVRLERESRSLVERLQAIDARAPPAGRAPQTESATVRVPVFGATPPESARVPSDSRSRGRRH